jgi:hypothetical protein
MKPVARELSFAERVALFVFALHREQTDALLGHLAEPQRRLATGLVGELTRCDSATRQARLTREFGARPDASLRLRELIVDASPAMRLALVEQLPEAQRALFPHLHSAAATPPAMRAVAARLVREALR